MDSFLWNVSRALGLTKRLRRLSCRGRLAGFCLWALAWVGAASSCDHRPLVDPVNTHYIRIHTDSQIKNVTTGFYNESYERPAFREPSIFRVILCDPATGRRITEKYLRGTGKDSRGHYVDGFISCEPGEYELLAYSFGTEATLVRSEENCYEADAYTGRHFGKAKEIHNEPDHLFATSDKVRISYSEKIDTIYASARGAAGGTALNKEEDGKIGGTKSSGPGLMGGNNVAFGTTGLEEWRHFKATSVAETYLIRIPVRNYKYASSITAVISGLSEGKNLMTRQMSSEAVGIFVEMSEGEEDIIHLGYDPDAVEDGTKSSNLPKVLLTGRASGGEDSVEDGWREEVTYVYAVFNTFGHLGGTASDIKVTFTIGTAGEKSGTVEIDITDEWKSHNAEQHNWLLIQDKIIDVPKPISSEGGFRPGVGNWNDVESDLYI